MAPEKDSTKQAPSPGGPSKPHDPELLMAARRGDYLRLERLLLSSAALGAPQLVIPIEITVDVEIMPSAAAVAPAAERDSLLHVVASSGDGDEYLKSASVIHRRARHLLDARNKNGDTPLHCAARAGCRGMVAHLVSLVRSENSGGGGGVEAMLRMQNKRGETVLHQAVRWGDREMIGRLMAEDPQLARVPLSEGASPLYLAVEMGHDDIARQLYDKDPALSYSGPDGRNALHAAVLKGQDTTKMLLEWNKDLIKEADRSTGSTPLHLAASWGEHEVISLLLAAHPSAAYHPDSSGSFPIHLAAFAGKVKAVSVLLDTGHGAELCDAKGRTFLHVAVQEESQSVVTYACKRHKFAASSFLNTQDDDGNTALHFAVEVGSIGIFRRLMENRSVALNVTNNKGQTPLDLAWSSVPAGVYIGLSSRIMIHKFLQDAGGRNGTHRCDLFYEEHIPRPDQQEQATKIVTSTQTIIVSSALVATVAFAAAFTLPGGYRGDDHENGGTPVLVGHSAFHVFIIANTLAFILSGLSITLLTYAGVANSDIRTRMIAHVIAATLTSSSARSLSVAFVFGLYVVLAPVARTTAVASFAITALAFTDGLWIIWVASTAELALLKRLGARVWWRLAWAILVMLLLQFWPYIVIVGVVKCLKVKRDH